MVNQRSQRAERSIHLEPTYSKSIFYIDVKFEANSHTQIQPQQSQSANNWIVNLCYLGTNSGFQMSRIFHLLERVITFSI